MRIRRRRGLLPVRRGAGLVTALEVAQERVELLTTLVQSWFDEWRAGRLVVDGDDADRRQVWELAKETKAFLDGRRPGER